MIDCPRPGCSGVLEEMFCNACGKVSRLSDLLTRFPTPEPVRRVEEQREDLAIREGGG